MPWTAIKYRKLRNILAHEAVAMTELNEIGKDDIKWVNQFAKSVEKNRDPISRYERKLKRYEIWRKARIVLIILGILATSTRSRVSR